MVGSTLVMYPWDKRADDDMGLHYVAPGVVTGSIDHRSNTHAGTLNTLPNDGGGFFAIADGEPIPSGALNLGSDLEEFLTASQVSGLAGFGITVRTTDRVLGAIYNSYLDPVNYDATGVNRCKPLRGSRRSGVKCYLGGFGNNGLIINERFAPEHVAMVSTLGVRHADYRRNREYADALDTNERNAYMSTLRKWNNYDSIKLFGQNFDVRVLPSGEPGDEKYADDGWEFHTTKIGDTFVEGSDTALASHTATGPNSGFSWAVLEGTWTVIAASDTVQASASDSQARAESALASDDHYTQADITVEEGLGNPGVVSRYEPTGNSQTYYYWRKQEVNNVLQQFRRVSGTFTQQGSDVAEDPTPTYTLKLEVNNSTIKGFLDSVEKISNTDTNITGNLFTGLRDSRSIASSNIDNFEAADLAAAGGGIRNPLAGPVTLRTPFGAGS